MFSPDEKILNFISEERIKEKTVSEVDFRSEIIEDGYFKKIVCLKSIDHSNLSSIVKNLTLIKGLNPEFAQLLTPSTVTISDGFLKISYNFSEYGNVENFVNFNSIERIHSIMNPLISRMINCLYWLHSQDLIHRNISPDHFLIFSDSNDFNIKLCGTSALCKNTMNRNDLPNFRYTKGKNSFLVWSSPEMIIQDFTGYNEKTDIYSLGLVIYYVISKTYPFSKCTDARLVYVEKLTNPVLSLTLNAEKLPDYILLLLKTCLNHNPTLRASTSDLMKLDWIKEALRENFSIHKNI